jgi:hypothetical protein
MSVCLPASARRLASLALAICGLTAFALALHTPVAGATTLQSQLLVPQIINGQEASISQFPWQVFVLLDEPIAGEEGACGGSILDPTHILTAAHCVDHEGTTSSYPPGDFLVIAGASEVLGFGLPLEDFEIGPTTFQASGLESFRTDPYYEAAPEVKDDVAVLELAEPLELAAAKGTAAISIVPTGATPTPGTALTISGYGKETGAEGSELNGKLYSTTLTAISSDACRDSVGANSAVLLCAVGSNSATCQGDSGGPLTEGNPAVEVGTVDFGPKECPVGQPDAFTNLAAPEIHAFLEGSEAPPVAARPTSLPVVKSVGPAPVDFSPLTCEPGGWSGSPSFNYTFQTESASPQALQSGPSNLFTPPASLVGTTLVCIVQATNPGGVSTLRSATTPAIADDAVPPVASITAVKCHLQTCTLSISASDPNAAALTLTASAAYQVTTKCPVRKGKKKKGKQPVCHKTHTVNMPVSAGAGVYQATATKLPYDERVTFTALATNAAGLRPTTPLVRSTTLRSPPKPKKKKKPKRG